MNAPVGSSALATLNGYFQKHKTQLAAALPQHLNPDRMVRLALTAFSQNPDLSECDPKTIFASIIVASQLGLEIGVSGQGFLVPYKGTCTFVPGWQGYVDLVSRSGRASVWTGAVFEGDQFDFELGSNPYVRHKPEGESDPAKMTHVYAVGRTKGSEWPLIEVWKTSRVIAHRDKHNKVGGRHYSYKNIEMYARKVPLLQVIKYLPKSVELTTAMQIDLAATEGRGAQYLDGEFVITPPIEGAAEIVMPDTKEPPKALPVWEQTAFERQFTKWQTAILDGKTTLEECVATMQKKAALSQDQLDRLNSIAPAGAQEI